MIFSMTGFGSAEYEDKDIYLGLEIRSLNHRFIETTLYVPEGFGIFEERLREKLVQRMKRGRIFLHLNKRFNKPETAIFAINRALAKKAVNDLRCLGKSLGIKGQVNINDIIALPNIVKVIPCETNLAHLWPKINRLAEQAIKGVMQMRRREGSFLNRDINARICSIANALSIIKKESPRIIKRFEARLRARLKDKDYSPEKLVEEVGVFARSIDISEEVVRLSSHVSNFARVVGDPSAEKGRTLDFMAQEMQREINTIGSKSSSINISKQVVLIKSNIEKIREQLSNVE